MFYYDIVESISEAPPRRTAVDGNTPASEHGGERARLAAYDYTALIDEYQVFRWATSMAFHDGEKLRLSISPIDIGDVIQEVQADAGRALMSGGRPSRAGGTAPPSSGHSRTWSPMR